MFQKLEVSKKTNQIYDNYSELKQRYDIGKMLVDAQGGEERAKYGDGLIKKFSERLTKELGKGYSIRNLKNMRKFYLFQKWQPLVAKLSWTHYTILLRLKNEDEVNYYINQILSHNISKRELERKIKSNEYERLDNRIKNN